MTKTKVGNIYYTPINNTSTQKVLKNVYGQIHVLHDNLYSRSIAKKQYELKNHLGNVQVVLSDLKQRNPSTSQLTAQTLTLNNYYPFGMLMPNRHVNTPGYRFGFNGMEMDDEVDGEGNSLDFGARIYDARLGRWLSVDPAFQNFPHQSDYVSFSNDPISRIDPDGATDYKATVKDEIIDDQTCKIKRTVDIEIVYNVLNLSKLGWISSSHVPTKNKNSIFDTQFTEYGAGLNGQDVEVHVNVSITYKSVSSLEEIPNDENVLFIVDELESSPSDKTGSNPIGRATLDGQVASVESIKGFNTQVIFHELGHNLGFIFEDNPEDEAHSKDSNHLMYGKSSSTNYKLNDANLKQVFKHFAHLNFVGDELSTVKNRHMGGGEAQEKAADFIKSPYIKTDRKKTKDAGF